MPGNYYLFSFYCLLNKLCLKGDSRGPLVQFFEGYFKKAVLIGTSQSGKKDERSGVMICGKSGTSYWTNIDLAENINWILETIEKN